MTRIAFISDIHGDLVSLEAALRRIDAMDCAKIVCCGDVVDGEPFVDEVIALLAARAIPTIRGNHCRWALERPAGLAISDESFSFLRRCPTSIDLLEAGVRVAVHHASPGSDMNGIIPGHTGVREIERHLERAGAQVLVVGHTHIPTRIAVSGGRLVVNPGALLYGPEAEVSTALGDRPPAPGTFGVLELPRMTFRVFRARDGEEVEAHGANTIWR